MENRIDRIRKRFHGKCAVCMQLADYKLIFDVGNGAKRIQWFCEKHFDKII
jgi:hypothetical protein